MYKRQFAGFVNQIQHMVVFPSDSLQAFCGRVDVSERVIESAQKPYGSSRTTGMPNSRIDLSFLPIPFTKLEQGFDLFYDFLHLEQPTQCRFDITNVLSFTQHSRNFIPHGFELSFDAHDLGSD